MMMINDHADDECNADKGDDAADKDADETLMVTKAVEDDDDERVRLHLFFDRLCASLVTLDSIPSFLNPTRMKYLPESAPWARILLCSPL